VAGIHLVKSRHRKPHDREVAKLPNESQTAFGKFIGWGSRWTLQFRPESVFWLGWPLYFYRNSTFPTFASEVVEHTGPILVW
jgi:hypothetical protein